MPIRHPFSLLIGALCLLTATTVTLAARPPTGYWLVQDGAAIVQISQTGETLSGRMVWLKEPTYPKDDPQGRAGKPKVDANNPDAARQGNPLIGLTLLSGFKPGDGPGVFSGGQVYDPKNGKTYSGTLTQVGDDRLDLRGYVLVSLIGRTSTWTRVDGAKYGLR